MIGRGEEKYIAHLENVIEELIDALYIQHQCGEPKSMFFNGWECEGWEFTHPDGRQWIQIGIAEDGAPMHPEAVEAIEKAERKRGATMNNECEQTTPDEKTKRFIAARNKPMVIDREEGNLYDVNDSYDVARILGRLDGIYGPDRFDYPTPEQVPHANPKGYIFDRTETRLIDMIREIEHLAQLLNGGGV